ncbi:hypothetical protein D3C75_999880 [compost metagenome]
MAHEFRGYTFDVGQLGSLFHGFHGKSRLGRDLDSRRAPCPEVALHQSNHLAILYSTPQQRADRLALT